MTDYIALSALNDFTFCPYSIYLHNVYDTADDETYKAPPQVKGTMAHTGIDRKSGSTRADDLMGLTVCSEALGIWGKIDLYRRDTHTLIERKNNLRHIYRGQLYQLWAQCFCLLEMGYDVQRLAFYEVSTRTTTPVPLPGDEERAELADLIDRFRRYDPLNDTSAGTAPAKCLHCIYCNLCDKTDTDNVYT